MDQDVRRWSDRLRAGVRLPRATWTVDPQTRVVPPERGRHAPYRRRKRLTRQEREEAHRDQLPD